jgi:hypothetical protein
MLFPATQLVDMGQTAILFPHGTKQDGARAWLARAEQARRIALMLAPGDAAVLENFARECEAKAAPPAPFVQRRRAIAA